MKRGRTEESGAGAARWLRRLGVGGFLFFFVKGLAWLIVPVLWVGLR